jgi:hypothetical protein
MSGGNQSRLDHERSKHHTMNLACQSWDHPTELRCSWSASSRCSEEVFKTSSSNGQHGLRASQEVAVFGEFLGDRNGGDGGGIG